jgi:uncharacterized protein (DUF302 family)
MHLLSEKKVSHDMKALEYPLGRSYDGVRELLKSRMNSKGQVVLREQDVTELMEQVDHFSNQAFEHMRCTASQKETT